MIKAGFSAPHPRVWRGFTMVEIMIALAVFAIAFMGLFSLMWHSMRTKREAREDIMAVTAANNQLERVLSADFASVFATYNDVEFSIPSQDHRPWRPAMQPGELHWRDATQQWTDNAGQQLNQGRIIFPNADPEFADTINEGVTPASISSDPNDPVRRAYEELGCPRDLNGDGDAEDQISANDPSLKLLPVVLHVEWEDLNGRHHERVLRMLLGPRR